ncbi:MAG TPA: S41 family peptidase [Acidimicrobiia bacterium]|nr:S41 family peptidase [Acidimicrobiia bacterium]
MVKSVLAAALLVSACTAGAGEATITTSAIPVTTAGITPTRSPPLPVQIEDCSTPQVPFSPLCQAYELIQEWHVDRPVAATTLAAAALQGLDGFVTEETADPPRALICAIPDPAFGELCDHLAARIDAASIPVGPAMEAAVIGMTDQGLDPFSYYVPPDQVGAFRSNGVVGGVGVLLDATDAVGSRCARVAPTCPLRIVFVVEDNPAAEAGLMAGDIITAIDGTNVDGLGFVEAVSRIAGDETGMVEITVERGEGVVEVFGIERDELTVPTVEIDIPRPGVGLIRIPDFEDDIPDLVRQGLTELIDSGIDTLVVDLRDNPGGYVDVSVLVMSEFIEEGVLVHTSAPGEEADVTALGDGVATDVDLVVLVNAGTASAAEITATALRDRRGAVIVGEPTFGKNAVQIPFELRNGGEFYVAVAHWTSPDGVSVAEGGIVPDHSLSLPANLTPEELVELSLGVVR